MYRIKLVDEKGFYKIVHSKTKPLERIHMAHLDIHFGKEFMFHIAEIKGKTFVYKLEANTRVFPL